MFGDLGVEDTEKDRDEDARDNKKCKVGFLVRRKAGER